MDTQIFDEIMNKKKEEIHILYDMKVNKNKKMIKDPSELDYYSKKTLNLINATLDKKLKSSKAYKKKCEQELLEKNI